MFLSPLSPLTLDDREKPIQKCLVQEIERYFVFFASNLMTTCSELLEYLTLTAAGKKLAKLSLLRNSISKIVFLSNCLLTSLPSQEPYCSEFPMYFACIRVKQYIQMSFIFSLSESRLLEMKSGWLMSIALFHYSHFGTELLLYKIYIEVY